MKIKVEFESLDEFKEYMGIVSPSLAAAPAQAEPETTAEPELAQGDPQEAAQNAQEDAEAPQPKNATKTQEAAPAENEAAPDPDPEPEQPAKVTEDFRIVVRKQLAKNKTSPRNHAIDTITIHCIVGQWTAKQGCDYFATTDRECSANYVVGKDGSIGLSVDEKDRSWCTSSRENDNRAITIEVASDTEHPYAVTDAAYSALIKLVADICQRNGIKQLVWSTNKADRVNHVNGCNMTVHRDYANKACPGQYLYERHGAIAAAVNAILGSGTTQAPEAAPEAVQGFPETPFTVRVIVPDLNYRKGPGMSYAVKGQTGKGVFFIFLSSVSVARSLCAEHTR